MSKSAINNPFLTELKDKNGESWYHQIILEDKDKEIERLNKEIETLNKEINKEMALTTEYESKYYDEYDENKRLKNIINELEESLKDDKEEYNKDLDLETKELYNEYWRGYSICANKNLDYLQELKGDGSNE